MYQLKLISILFVLGYEDGGIFMPSSDIKTMQCPTIKDAFGTIFFSVSKIGNFSSFQEGVKHPWGGFFGCEGVFFPSAGGCNHRIFSRFSTPLGGVQPK